MNNIKTYNNNLLKPFNKQFSNNLNKKMKIDVNEESDIIFKKIINIITEEFDDINKFNIEEIKIFNKIENINELTIQILNDYILTFKKKLFIFDLKLLGRDWIKNIKFIPQSEIIKEKYKNNILFIHYINHKFKISVFPRNADIKLYTLRPVLNFENKCNFCNKFESHVKIDKNYGKIMCIKCYNNLSKISLNSLETIYENHFD